MARVGCGGNGDGHLPPERRSIQVAPRALQDIININVRLSERGTLSGEPNHLRAVKGELHRTAVPLTIGAAIRAGCGQLFPSVKRNLRGVLLITRCADDKCINRHIRAGG